MDYQSVFYWLGILGGNACYTVFLLALGGVMKKRGLKRACYMLMMAGMSIGFILLDPFSKEIKLPGIASGEYAVLKSGIRISITILCMVIPHAFMRVYRFFAFNLRMYRNKNNMRVSFYVYHTVFFLICLSLQRVWIISTIFFITTLGGSYKTSWEGIFGVLLVIYYIGGICMAVLRQKTFEMADGHFKYYGLRKIREGALEDIEAVEKTNKGIVLHVKGEKLFIRCRMEELADLFRDKIINPDGGEKEGEEAER